MAQVCKLSSTLWRACVTTAKKVAGCMRIMQEEDLPIVLQWRNHQEVRRFMYSQHEISLEEHQRWFSQVSGEPNRHLLIYQCEGLPLGFVNFHQLRSSAVAEWGFYLAPDAARGTGMRLGQAALDYAFNQLALHKVCGEALDYNQRSQRFHQKLGFSEEGILRDHYFDGSRYHAVHCFGLLASEWARIDSEI